MRQSFLITIFSVLLISFTFSCSKKSKSSTGECSANVICYTQEPGELYVKLELTQPKNNVPTEVTFYKGNIDKGEILEVFPTLSTEVVYLVPVGIIYSATAKYVVDGDTVIVVDGDKLTTSYCTDGDTECYDWDHEMVLDLKLKE